MRQRLLRPDNVTPPARTPWGGRKLLDHYKRGLMLDPAVAALPLVGESWEISVEPSFPSRFADDDTLLAQAIARDPEAWLGSAVAARHGGQTPLLVKLLDAAANLSVQVHPAEDDPGLAPDESGKLESWYILDAEPGAGVYLGFQSGVGRRDVEDCLRKRSALAKLMNFVPVTRGDAFFIRAGIVHAVGAGVTLVEPQFVTPARRGVTYRYWDWNRCYDEGGQLSATGEPRALHVERCLEVTAWNAERGHTAVDMCRARPRVLDEGPLSRTLVADWPYFAVERWAGKGSLTLPAQGTMLAIVCVAGRAEIVTESGKETIRLGQSMVVPQAAGALRVQSLADAGGRDTGVEIIATRSP